jgi:hypothetical protein
MSLCVREDCTVPPPSRSVIRCSEDYTCSGTVPVVCMYTCTCMLVYKRSVEMSKLVDHVENEPTRFNFLFLIRTTDTVCALADSSGASFSCGRVCYALS